MKESNDMQRQRSKYLQTFLEMIQDGDYLVLDTETTGLHDGEIVQIAIIDSSGFTSLDALVKPSRPIPPDATRIHGITDEMVNDSPTWAQLTDYIASILRGRNVVVYNAVYDRKMMHQSAEKAGLPKVDWKGFSNWWCAMDAFSEVYGEWNSYHRSYRWQRLTTAARYYRLPVVDAHSALGDCRITLGVVKAMAGVRS